MLALDVISVYTTCMIFPNINPIAFSIGPFSVYWYSLSYVVGILVGWFYAYKIIKKFELGITAENLDHYVTWTTVAIIVGSRLGLLLYEPIKYFTDPISLLKVYEGGMSFHGGVIGLITSNYLFSRKYKISFLLLNDLLATIAPFGLCLGRITNFINGELYGRVTDMPWGMVFPNSDLQARHPSQLYEAFFEGAVLFAILCYATFKYKTIKIPSLNSAIFLTGYSVSRIIMETFREVDSPHIGFILKYLTMGQILSVPMLMLGIYFIIRIKCQSTLK